MNTVFQYKTGMWVVEQPSFFQRKFNGRGWNIIFVEDKSKYPKHHNGKEIVICAKYWKTAQQAANLILASMLLDMGDTMDGLMSNIFSFVYSEQKNCDDNLPKHIIERVKDRYFSTPSLSTACLIAVKASTNKHYCYAISKFSLSCEIYSPASVDIDPFHSENMKISSFYDDHVRFASAITIAYSAIEELNLQIKASSKKPSFLKNGDWNPEVKMDIEARLLNNNINLDELFLWSVRGTSRKIDRINPPKPASKPLWRGTKVRDLEIYIIDAINNSSWLRSKISAHGFGKLTPSLSPYDVANVQRLVRRLILESLGFWRFRL